MKWRLRLAGLALLQPASSFTPRPSRFRDSIRSRSSKPQPLESSRGNEADFFSRKDPEVVASLNRLVFSPKEAAAYGVEGEINGPNADIVTNCPLWRVSWASLPGVREGYHVHMPIFTTMFERLLSAPRPWYFVQLYIPGGVKNSWKPENALAPTQPNGEPTAAPRIGVLMEITHGSRLPDGRMVLLANSLSRCRVLEQTQDKPFQAATVQLLPDAEEIAVAREAGDGVIAGPAAWAAAAAAARVWRGYEESSLGVYKDESSGQLAQEPVSPFNESVGWASPAPSPRATSHEPPATTHHPSLRPSTTPRPILHRHRYRCRCSRRGPRRRHSSRRRRWTLGPRAGRRVARPPQTWQPSPRPGRSGRYQ